MAKNRKYQSAGVRFGPALNALILCVIIGGAGVGYVWQKSQINELGRQIGQREQRLKELKTQNEKLSDQLAVLRSPAKLDQRLRELNLGLVMPQPNQVWRLAEPTLPPSLPGNAPFQQVAYGQVRGRAVK
jgi:uncharacterized protein HemX